MTRTSLEPPETQLPDDAFRVISKLYESVTPGGTYEPMFLAMDDFIEATLHDVGSDTLAAPLDPEFLAHFERAAHVFNVMTREDVRTPLSFVEAHKTPVAVVNRSGLIVAQNSQFAQNLALQAKDITTLADLFATPADAKRFGSVSHANNPSSKTLVNIVGSEGERPITLLTAQVPKLVGTTENESFLSVMMIQPQWSDEIAELLQAGFGLTRAEIETLEAFVIYGSVKKISDIRKRSIRTVRTQLSRIFGQMGVSSQTELALFLATLGHVQSQELDESPQTPDHVETTQDIRRHLLQIDGSQTEVLEYGDPSGAPVLLLQTTHPPALTKALRNSLRAAGLRIIAPFKPRSGKSAALPGRQDPTTMAPRYAEILRQLDVPSVIVAGQASGGLYALGFARHASHLCKGVCLIDTGVPFLTRADLMHQPKSIRRTMVAARYFPKVLYLPHRLVATNFHQSLPGERSVIEYFFSGSPIDQNLTRTQKDAYAVTREIIAYSFDDIDGLVEDVVRWASNWKADLDAVVATTPLRFIHGAENTMFQAEPIQTFASQNVNCTAHIVPDAGQLAVFQNPHVLAETLTALKEEDGP